MARVGFSNRPVRAAGTRRPTRSGILAAIGATPLVELERLLPSAPFRVFAKLEALNPGGSIKDRPALNMLADKLERGELEPGRSVVVESSSGNLGVGLAQVCRVFGLRFVCVVDPKTTDDNVALMRAYGAEVEVVTERDAATGEYLPTRIRRVHELCDELSDAYWPNQYANLLNAAAHVATMGEIVDELGHADYVFCATSSCGTLRGCSRYVRRHGLETEVVAVDALGSVIFGREPGRRLIPGHGAAARPALYCDGLADAVVHVGDLDCVVGCRRLALREAIVAGGSSGAIVSALEQLQDEIPEAATCVLILPDRGERYLDTIYSDAWVEEHFGDVSHLWAQPAERNEPC